MGECARRLVIERQSGFFGGTDCASDCVSHRTFPHQCVYPRAFAIFTNQGRAVEQGSQHRCASCLLLCGLSAQQLHPCTFRQSGLGRHWLPCDGDIHLSRIQQTDHPHGWRRRALDWTVVVFQVRPRVPKFGRWHIFSLWLIGHSCGHRSASQHHLQNFVQRCSGHDRWSTGRWQFVRVSNGSAVVGRRCAANRIGHRGCVTLCRSTTLARPSHGA